MKALDKKTILIVDDEILLLDLFRDMLEHHGAIVHQANNTKAAFEILKNHKIDMMISDVRMPRGDGISLAKKIMAELNYQPRMFLCTGFKDDIKEDHRSFGVEEIFEKPFREDSLISAITNSFKKSA